MTGYWVIKCLGMSSYPVPLVEKSRASCPGGRFPPSFINQVIIITRLNKYKDWMDSEDGLRCRHPGVKLPFTHSLTLARTQ